MVIALLVVLGVDLAVVVAFVVSVLGRKRWVRRQAGAFHGAIRVISGEIDGLGPTWRRGYGRWVGHVLVWTKGPFLLRNELVPADGAGTPRPSRPEEVTRLGDRPQVVRVRTGAVVVDVAASADDAERLCRPDRGPVAVVGTAVSPSDGDGRL